MQKFAAVKKELIPNSAARRVFGLIGAEMGLIEAEFERQVSSNIQVINYLGDYLRASGGKRIRPALLVLAHHAIDKGERTESVIRMATVMEMLHTATLVHDDIIDNADIRRNRPSVNARFGNQTAVLMGDWLYMSAFETTTLERSLDIIDILTRLTRKMTEGELIQLTRIGRLDISESEYFDILKRKTAYLFSSCCEVGAILGGANEDERDALRAYGMDLGIAFQLSDDILDLTADSKDLGKAAGSDLLEGKLTLPLIYLLEKRPELKPKLEEIMFDGEYRTISREELKSELVSLGLIDSIKQRATSHAEAARKSLAVLGESEYRSSLEEVLSFVTDRTT
ncbi:MAG: polyprenyl synthetase family protein [Acidobacteria bacterium]|nr:polyprenyl synthetase family protein [Acidobacteriota bacterium]MBP7474552.1 polyprenyl synthetase family protein [Pyrinomonadaceae bacterium]MBP9108897.1 polyprenyl synthetase family protein [Pyrinomonadaceae bacterium]